MEQDNRDLLASVKRNAQDLIDVINEIEKDDRWYDDDCMNLETSLLGILPIADFIEADFDYNDIDTDQITQVRKLNTKLTKERGE